MSEGLYAGSPTPTESYEEWKETTRYQLKPAGYALVFVLVSLLVTGVFYMRPPKSDFTKKETIDFSIKGVPFTLSRESK